MILYELPRLKSDSLPLGGVSYKKTTFLKEEHSLALANVQLNLQLAMRNHFDKKRKKNTGFLRFKSAKHSRYIKKEGLRILKSVA